MKKLMQTIQRHFTVWMLFAKYELLQQFSSKTSMVFFFVGKIIRFFSFFVILLLLRGTVRSVSGYTVDEVLIFFLTFNFIDIVSQMFLRGVYGMNGIVRSGEFDFYLMRPINPLFRSLMGAPDFNDVLLFMPLTGFSVWYIHQILPDLTPDRIFSYIILLIGGFLISVSFHILVLASGVVSTEIDHTIMLYRDLTQMARFPIDIYREPFRAFITFIIPIGVMMSFPSKALLGVLQPHLMIVGAIISVVSFFLSLKIWDIALKKYSSASS
jgi:ABC-2 type transport system permease protein